ncbi:MAG: RNB domain-containing ribonuclease [Burkholderiales bacterium]|nr:RNB domain-containing ribonuclease [Burkholderiales bacterium]
MNLLFEDEGQIKAGAILSDKDNALQIELPGGRRIKVKAASVLLRFETPTAAQLLAEASTLATAQAGGSGIDMQLLWESAEGAADGEDFGFVDLAREYFGVAATPVQQAATALALQHAPMYFYKRGKGRYKRAPEGALKAALASIERKAREAEQVDAWVKELVAGCAPAEIAVQWAALLHAPDRQSLAYKALAAAADRARMAPVHLLARAGAIPSTHALHFEKFLRATFPKGIAFPAGAAVPPIPDLTEADVAAFSIDDDSTTEIDDAFSLSALPGGGWRLGIHIAAPAVAIVPGSALDRVARDRLSTVYMPGNKITMLPDAVVGAFSLDAGKTPPALSLYAELDADLNVVATRTTLERVAMASNLRIPVLDQGRWLEPGHDGAADNPHAASLRILLAFAKKLAAERGDQAVNRVDYNFAVTGDPDAADCRIDISTRQRGSPVDTLVSELMIFANVSWAKALAAREWVGMFRVQGAGKTRMSTAPGAHEGLNVPCYLWATSPLRRYSDLVNQRQLIALTREEAAPYQRGNAELLSAVADFDATYSGYAEFQQQMEFYWCLRYLQQESIDKLTARVIRENLVRFDRLPIVQRINDMPFQAPGMQVVLAVAEVDLFEPALHVRFVETVPGTPDSTDDA